MEGIYTFWVPKTVCVHSGGGSVGVDPEGAHPPNFAQSKSYLCATLNHSRWAWIVLPHRPSRAPNSKAIVVYYIYPDRQKILTSWNPASHQKLRLRRENVMFVVILNPHLTCHHHVEYSYFSKKKGGESVWPAPRRARSRLRREIEHPELTADCKDLGHAAVAKRPKIAGT